MPVWVSKPDTDARDYQYLQLSNGLRVIVASDPDNTSMAAAALAVQAGSLDEPKDIPGLAHLCEHMVLHGTFAPKGEKEPFATYVKQHGGTHNAVTTMRQTCFAFDVRPDRLEGALKRFAHFFTNPEFSRTSISQEIKAIDSEHSMNRQNDFRRQWAILLLDANPLHPYHWGSGCQKSLQGSSQNPDLHKALLTYHKRNFLAERMTLAVVSTQTTAEIAKLVQRYFTAVPRDDLIGVPRLGMTTGHISLEPSFRPEDFCCEVLVVPAKEARQLRLAWLLPWQVSRWRSKPTSYMSYLLGHEGRGSVLSALKATGHAIGVSTACLDYHGCASTFEISVDLAEGALQETALAEVGEIIFAYLRLLRARPPQAWVFEEQRRLRALDFRFQDDCTTYDLAQDLACNLHYYPPEDVLAGDHLLYEIDSDTTAVLLEKLTVTNARLWIVAREHSGLCTESEPWYGSKFLKRSQISDTLSRAWRAVEAGDWESIAEIHGLRLPSPNRFLPDVLPSITALTVSKGGVHPVELALEEPWCRAWHREGAVLSQPKAAASIYFHCPMVATDVQEAAATHLLCQCVQEELREECAYEARMAGVMYKLERAETGVVLQLLGFSDRLGEIAGAVAQKLAEFGENVPERTWSVVYDQQERLLGNSARGAQAYSQAMAALEELISEPRRSAEALHGEVFGMQRSNLEGLGRRLFGRDCLVEALLVGHLTEDQARTLLRTVLQPLAVNRESAALPRGVPPRSEVLLSAGGTALSILTVDNKNPEDANSCAVVSLCGVAEVSPENEAVASVLMSLVKPLFFSELRTRQQLGYVVSSFMRARVARVSLVFVVQTERAPEIARRSIDSFLRHNWQQLLRELTEEELADHCGGLIRQLQESPRNLWEAMQRDWLPIEERTLAFDHRSRQIASLRALTLPAMRRFIDERVRCAPRLCVLVRGRRAATGSRVSVVPEERAARIISPGGPGIAAFRAGLARQPIRVEFGAKPAPLIGVPFTGERTSEMTEDEGENNVAVVHHDAEAGGADEDCKVH